MCTVCFRATSPGPVKPGRGADADWLLGALWLLLLWERWQQQQPRRDSVTAGCFIADAVELGEKRRCGSGGGVGVGVGEGRERLPTQQFSQHGFFSLQHLNASLGSSGDNEPNVNAIFSLVWLS